MVRPHVRTFAAVMKEFDKLDKKEGHLKSFFEPSLDSENVTKELAAKAARAISPHKHRYR